MAVNRIMIAVESCAKHSAPLRVLKPKLLLACLRQRSSPVAVKAARSFAAVLVTAPNLKSARSLAKTILQAKAAACANLVPQLESHYWWQGKLERGNEVLLIFKTSKGKLPVLEKLILEHHPYDTPEMLALPIVSGTERYLAWLGASLD